MNAHLTLEGPLDILVIEGLTLPKATSELMADIEAAAPAGSALHVAAGMREAAGLAPNAHVILGLVNDRLFALTERLKWVHAIASGVDMFMFDDFIESDVVLTGEKGLVGGHLADTAFGLLLSLTRQIHPAIALGAEGWNNRTELRSKQIELESRTMGIVGYGGTGRAMAARAKGFGMHILAVDEFPPDGEDVWPSSRLDDLLAASDVVAVCCPLSDKTRLLFGADAFSKMRPGSYIVNVTRGEVVENAALVAALQSGHLGGAALDVVEGEPLDEGHPLFHLDNVAMTPHTAGGSSQRAKRNVDRFVRNLRATQSGDALEGVVDKRLGY
jgi:D-3-phosphoglycerate dehydrogenase